MMFPVVIAKLKPYSRVLLGGKHHFVIANILIIQYIYVKSDDGEAPRNTVATTFFSFMRL